MATITNKVLWATNSAQLASELQVGLQSISLTQTAVDKLAKSLQGDALIQAAQRSVAAITQIGGATKLTAAEAERNLALIEKAIDKLTVSGKAVPSAMLAMRDSLKQVATAGDAVASSHSKLGEVLRLNIPIVGGLSAKFTENVAALGVLGGVIGAAVVGYELLKKAIDIGAEVSEAAKQLRNLSTETGVGVEQLQAIGSVTKDVGVDTAELARGMFQLSRRVAGDDASASAALGVMGLNIQSLKKLAPDELFLTIMRAVNQIPDPMMRSAVAAQLFGARFAQAFLAIGPGLDEIVEKAKTSGEVMSREAVEGAAKFSDSIDHLSLRLKALTGEGLAPTLDYVSKIIDLMRGGGLSPLAGIAMLEPGHLISRLSDTIVGGQAATASSLAPMTPAVSHGATASPSGSVSAGALAMTNQLASLRAQIVPLTTEQNAYLASLAKIGPEFVTTANLLGTGISPQQLTVWKAAQAALKQQAEEAARLAKTIADLNSANVSLNETDQLVVITQHARGMGEADLAKYIGATTEQVRATIKADEERTKEAAAFTDLRRSIEKTANEESLKEYNKWAEGVSKAADDVGKHIVDGAVQIGAAEKDLADILAKQGLSSWDYQIVKIEEWATSAKGAFKGTADQAKEFYDLIDREAKAKIDAIDSDWDTLKAHSTASLQHTADVAAATYDYMKAHSDEFSAKTIQDFKAIADEAQRTANGAAVTWSAALSTLGTDFAQLAQVSGGSFGGIVQDIGKIVSAMKLGQDAAEQWGKADSAVGKGLAAVGMVTAMASATQGGGAKGAIGGAITGAEMGMEIAGPWGAAAGAAIGLVVGIIRTDHRLEDVARDAGEKFGTVFSDATAKAIADDMDKGMSEVGAELNNLDKIIADMGGITAQNVGRITDRFHDLFSMLQTGQMTAKQVNAQLTASFPALQKASTDAFGNWSAGLKEIIRLDGIAQTKNETIAAALKEQGANALSAFNDVATSMLTADKLTVWDDLKKKVDDATASGTGLADALQAQKDGADLASSGLKDLGIQAIATFTAAEAAGMSEADALKAIHPALASLQHAYEDLGISTDDAALAALMMRDKIATAAPALSAGISGLSGEMIALNNMGLLNAQTFGAMERTGKSLYDQLIAKTHELGGTDADAIGQMQKYLHEVIKAAEDLGIPIDENTQALIDQSKAAGIWQDALTPDDKMLNAFSSPQKAVEHLTNALRGIPDAVDTTVTTHYQTTGDPTGQPPIRDSSGDTYGYAALGAFVTQTGLQPLPFSDGGIVPQYLSLGGRTRFHPLGTDTVPAMLTPGELVLNKDQQAQLAAAFSMPESLIDPNSPSAWPIAQTTPTLHPLPVQRSGPTSTGSANITIEIHAVDAKSFDDLVRKNPDSITKAVIGAIEDNRRGATGQARRALQLGTP